MKEKLCTGCNVKKKYKKKIVATLMQLIYNFNDEINFSRQTHFFSCIYLPINIFKQHLKASIFFNETKKKKRKIIVMNLMNVSPFDYIKRYIRHKSIPINVLSIS